MKARQSNSAILAGVTLIALAFTTIPQTNAAVLPQSVKIARTVPCSAIRGTWYHSGKGIPVSQYGDRIRVNMSAFRRPTANGRVLSATQIEVTFPDDATFVGTLDGQGTINWNNGTAWQATNFAGTWQYEGQWGPVVTQLGDRLRVSMSRYGRPMARGNKTAPSQASVNFTDDATHTATLVSPTCIQWSNGTTWTK